MNISKVRSKHTHAIKDVDAGLRKNAYNLGGFGSLWISFSSYGSHL